MGQVQNVGRAVDVLRAGLRVQGLVLRAGLAGVTSNCLSVHIAYFWRILCGRNSLPSPFSPCINVWDARGGGGSL